MSYQAYPLQWPQGWNRTPASARKNAQFSRRETNYRDGHSWTSKKWLTVNDGLQRIFEPLERMGISRDDVVVSTNIPTRLDGMPRSGAKEPDDPGAAVYWRNGYKAPMRCMAIDRYTSTADNLAAIAATLEAMRAIERHGGAEILDRTFTGFAALTDGNQKPWRDALGFDPLATIGLSEVEARFRELARQHHPDAGGDTARFQELTKARDEARKELAA